jgi:hypothetical protein
VKDLDVALDCGAVCPNLPLVGLEGLCGGNGVNGHRSHDLLVQQQGVHHIVVFNLLSKG